MRCPFAGILGLSLSTSMLACAPEEDLGVRTDRFGTVFFELRRAAFVPATPYVDTRTVTAEVTLGECLTEFYADHSEWAIDGSKGSVVAGAWEEYLCDWVVFEDVFPCVTTGHEWLPGAGAEGRTKMRVHFDALTADIEYFELRVGPIAREGFAGCEPRVHLDNDSITATNSSGQPAWRIEHLGTQTAVTDQLDGVKAYVEPID
jgi:hypothetical protein